VQFLIIMALMLGVMYVLMIRPQRQRQAQQQATIDNAGVGDDVLTTGGIYGTIRQVEGDDVVVELAPELTVHMTRRGIAAVLPPEEDEAEEDEAGEDEAEEDEAEEGVAEEGVAEDEDVDLAELSAANGDEAAVTEGEEAVRTAPSKAPAEEDHR
jgi:preprotein translocase subunit YajC